MSKKMKLMVLTAALTLGAAMTSYAGWKPAMPDGSRMIPATGGRTMTEATPQAAGIGWMETETGFPSAIILTGTVTWRPIPPPRTATRWMEAEPGW